jgi:hypothetical protein
MTSCQWSPAPTKLEIERVGGRGTNKKNGVEFRQNAQKREKYSSFFPEEK